MVGLFVVIVVWCGLRAGAPQPPDGVARRHQPREAVPSHHGRATRAFYTPSTSSRQCSLATGQDRMGSTSGQEPISRAALTKLGPGTSYNYNLQHYEQKASLKRISQPNITISGGKRSFVDGGLRNAKLI